MLYELRYVFVLIVLMFVTLSCGKEEPKKDDWVLTENKMDFNYANGFQPKNMSKVIDVGREDLHEGGRWPTADFHDQFCGFYVLSSDRPLFNVGVAFDMFFYGRLCEPSCGEDNCIEIGAEDENFAENYNIYISFPAAGAAWYKINMNEYSSSLRGFWTHVDGYDDMLLNVEYLRREPAYKIKVWVYQGPCVTRSNDKIWDEMEFLDKFRSIDFALEDKVSKKIFIARRTVLERDQYLAIGATNTFYTKFRHNVMPNPFQSTCVDDLVTLE